MHQRNRMVGGFEDAFEKGQSTIKKSVKNSTTDFTNATKNQITGSTNDPQVGSSPATDQGTNEVASGPNQSQQKTDEERVKFLRDLYGSGTENSKDVKVSNKQNDKNQKGTGDIKQALGVPQKDPHEGMTPEEIVKYEAAKRQLHGDYYQEFIAKTKRQEEPVKEKLEREEQEKKMEDLKEQQKKNAKKPINPAIVKQGTAETAPGTIG